VGKRPAHLQGIEVPLEKIANEIGVDFLEFFTPIPEEDS
jgi:hypothetical protein